MENDTKYEYLELGKGLVQTIEDHYVTVHNIKNYHNEEYVSDVIQTYIDEGIFISFDSCDNANRVKEIEDDE